MTIYPNTLTIKNVSIQKSDIEVGGYDNSAHGRSCLEADCTTEIVSDVYKVWGDTPTVVEPSLELIPKPQPTEQDNFNADILFRMIIIEMGA